jgi:hypothetical protein
VLWHLHVRWFADSEIGDGANAVRCFAATVIRRPSCLKTTADNAAPK